jgi:hypothetical protein
LPETLRTNLKATQFQRLILAISAKRKKEKHHCGKLQLKIMPSEEK